MKIKFLGTGGAFQVEYGNSSAVVEVNGRNILLDCGYSVFPKLLQSGLAGQIDAILITHLHDDHVGSLSSFILYHALVLKKGKVRIIYQSEAFLTILKDFLSYSLGRPQERVEFVPISEYPEIGAIDTFGQHVPGMSTWAFFFKEGDEAMVFSGDLGNPHTLFSELASMDLPGRPLVFHEMMFEESYGHTFYRDLEAYQGQYRIYGYHHDHLLNPPDNRIPLVANSPEFLV